MVSEDLPRRFREANGLEVEKLLHEHEADLDIECVRQALRNPYVTSEAIAFLLDQGRLTRLYEVRRDLAIHPKTPQIRAMRFVPGLRWRDLIQIVTNLRVPPQVRRLAERNLTTRLPGLALGERIALARLAAGPILQQLKNDGHPRVIAALLENPRMTEGVLASMLRSQNTPAEVLSQVADNSRWGARYEVRLALVRHARMPLQRALGLLPGLRKVDLRSLSKDRKLRPQIRDRAGLLAG